jgi:uncharacterized protein (TIGR02265 family)
MYEDLKPAQERVLPLVETNVREVSLYICIVASLMQKPNPTIKGIFINSHIKALERARGSEAVKQLEQLYGRPLFFKTFADVPVAEEVKILDYIIEILYGDMPAPKKAYEGGRLHLRNFLATHVGKLLLLQSRTGLKATLLLAGKVAGLIFKGVVLETEDYGKQTVKITVRYSAYPLEHFQGFFQEWLAVLGYLGTVSVEPPEGEAEIYLIDWHQP